MSKWQVFHTTSTREYNYCTRSDGHFSQNRTFQTANCFPHAITRPPPSVIACCRSN